MEGLERILCDWLKFDKKLDSLKEEKEALREWRQNIAHSNVRKPNASSKRRKKEKTERNKLGNRFLKKMKKDYERILNSINFVMQAIVHARTKG